MQTMTTLPAKEAWARAGAPLVREAPPHLRRSWQVDRDYYGRIEALDVANMRLARIRATTPLCIENKRSGEFPNSSDALKLLLQVSGRSILQQGGREVALEPGTWTLYRGAAPFALQNIERCEQRLVIVRQRDLQDLMLDLEPLFVRRLGAADRSSGLLVRLLDIGFDNASRFALPAAWELAGTALHLARLALLETAQPRSDLTRAEIMRERIRKYVEQNLRDPGLCVDGIARALSCSKRYLHKVFATQGETLAQYILHRRLDKCFEELRRETYARGSIAELAYAWGFNSLSYFGRAFSKRFGTTPTALRLSRAEPSSAR
jgi:AraC-like DNA-binding protein